MSLFSAGMPLPWTHIGTLVGFLLSLMIFSFVLRDNLLVRVAQYLLVGVTLAYVAVLVWHSILWPRLFRPLFVEPLAAFETRALPANDSLWLYGVPLLLGLLLWIAGLDYLRGPLKEQSGVRPWLRLLALLPAGLLVGVGLGVGIAGTIQGTLGPQFLRAAELGWSLDAAPGLLVGALTLLITIGVLLYLQVGEVPQPRALPALLAPLVQGWGWIGQRALWLAAGFLFARLFASRLTLLIARLDYFLFDVRTGELWAWLQTVLGGR